MQLSNGYAVWVKITLSLHGQVVLINSQETQELCNPLKLVPPYALLLFQVVDCSHLSIGLVDCNRLASAEFISIPSHLDPRHLRVDSSVCGKWIVHGYCTMTQYNNWRDFIVGNTTQWSKLSKSSNTSIFVFMIDNQNWFEGIGTSHCSEILHIAEEHPATLARIIMQSEQQLSKLCDAIKIFYDKAHSQEYLQHVPSGSSGSAFYESSSTTQYVNSQFHKVYGKTNVGVLIPVERYDNMVMNHQLDPCYLLSTTELRNHQVRLTQKKRVKVYAIHIRANRGIAYTCIFLPHPYSTNPEIVKGNWNVERPLVVPDKEVIKKGFGQTRRAEIGIASFMDSKRIEEYEHYSTYRRYPLRSGAIGRPRLTKGLYSVQNVTMKSKDGKIIKLGHVPCEHIRD